MRCQILRDIDPARLQTPCPQLCAQAQSSPGRCKMDWHALLSRSSFNGFTMVHPYLWGTWNDLKWFGDVWVVLIHENTIDISWTVEPGKLWWKLRGLGDLALYISGEQRLSLGGTFEPWRNGLDGWICIYIYMLNHICSWMLMSYRITSTKPSFCCGDVCWSRLNWVYGFSTSNIEMDGPSLISEARNLPAPLGRLGRWKHRRFLSHRVPLVIHPFERWDSHL